LLLDAQLWANLSQKLHVVVGDVSLPRLGLNDDDYMRLCPTLNVIIASAGTYICLCRSSRGESSSALLFYFFAADVNFHHKLSDTIYTNVGGAKELFALAQNCEHLQALVHISTQFVADTWRASEPFPEQLPVMPHPADWEDLLQRPASYLDENAEEITKGWSNHYLFTKALTEHMLVELRRRAHSKGERVVPLAIARPSIVTVSAVACVVFHLVHGADCYLVFFLACHAIPLPRVGVQYLRCWFVGGCIRYQCCAIPQGFSNEHSAGTVEIAFSYCYTVCLPFGKCFVSS
jgi:hypothetical protein